MFLLREDLRDVMEVNSKKCRTRTYWFISITLITRLDILFPLFFLDKFKPYSNKLYETRKT